MVHRQHLEDNPSQRTSTCPCSPTCCWCLGLVLRLCVLHAGSSFPRLVKLVEVLKTYSSKSEFHGIVFVRQRQVWGGSVAAAVRNTCLQQT